MGKPQQNSEKGKKREVGIQSIIQPKLYDSPHILAQKNLETVEYNRFFYISHTLTFMVLGVIAMNVLIHYTRGWSYEQLQLLALKAIVFFVLMFSAFYMPDTIVTRPHPFIWRCVLGANLMYLSFLIYISFIPLDQARKTFKIFDSRLGEPLPERSYADDCRFYTPDDPVSMFRNFSDAVFDVHFVAHLIGWVCKVLIIRDIKICWVCSIVFELTELTFKHWLPNFAECWWDHLLLDVFGCNMLGIIIGAAILRYMSVNKLHWVYYKQKKDERYLYDQCSAINRAIYKLKPEFLIKHDWKVFKSLKRFYGVLFFCCICLAVDLNNFFMKTILWVPPEHDLLKFRLLLWCPLALAGAEEYFEYITNPYSKRVRPHMWLILIVLATELGIIFRNSFVYTGAPFPLFVKVMWAIIFSIILSITAWIICRKKTEDDNEPEWNPYDPPVDIKEVN